MEAAIFNFLNSIVAIQYELFAASNPYAGNWILIKHGGWVFIVWAFFWGLKEWWLYWRQGIFAEKQRYVVLAIDVPKENEQGPKAVENLFAQIYGAYKAPNLIEKYIDGFLTPKFSFEIISIGGYLQFIIHLPVSFRNLVEAAIYAQYPDAEITEVEDYVGSVPTQYPNPTHDLWGTEFVLYKKNCYPIRTYPAFEYGLTQEFKDPMASLLEIMNHISPQENIWLQFVITPIPADWRKEGEKIVKKLIGGKVPEAGAQTYAGKLGGKTQAIMSGAFNTVTATLFTPSVSAKKEEKQTRSEMLFLSPGEKTTVEAIENKISKFGFDTKFRFLYWGQRSFFSKQRGVNGVLGSLAQLGTLDMNGFKPHPRTKTTIDYFFIKRRVSARKRRLVAAFKARSNWRGWGHFILNVEELATLWHFPMLDVKAPLLKKTESKRVEPPFSLPVEQASVLKPKKSAEETEDELENLEGEI